MCFSFNLMVSGCSWKPKLSTLLFYWFTYPTWSKASVLGIRCRRNGVIQFLRQLLTGYYATIGGCPECHLSPHSYNWVTRFSKLPIPANCKSRNKPLESRQPVVLLPTFRTINFPLTGGMTIYIKWKQTRFTPDWFTASGKCTRWAHR